MAVVVFRESAEFAFQINDARLFADYLDSEFIVPLLQLPDLLPVLIFFDQALRVLGLCLIAGSEGLQWGKSTALDTCGT